MVSSESGYLNDFSAEAYVNNTEASTNLSRISKQGFYFLRLGIGGHIKIFWVSIEQNISDTATNQVCKMACWTEPVNNFRGAYADFIGGKELAYLVHSDCAIQGIIEHGLWEAMLIV